MARRRHDRDRHDVGGRAASPPGRRSRRRCAAASRSCGRPAITRCRTARWASASSTTSRSPPASRSASSASSASRSSTSTSITATARKRRSGTTTACCSSRCTSGRSIQARGGPDEQRETTLNVPMSAGSGDDEYLHAFDHAVGPAVERFEPELVLVSAGFDAHTDDPLAGMCVTADGFREMARRCRAYGAARRGRPRGRLRARHAAHARRRGARRLHRTMRIDKWLWAARFFKTRSLATEAVLGGHVHVGDARVKPARDVRVGDTVEIRRGPMTCRRSSCAPSPSAAALQARRPSSTRRRRSPRNCANSTDSRTSSPNPSARTSARVRRNRTAAAWTHFAAASAGRRQPPTQPPRAAANAKR